MFTWICPKCGSEVPPSESDCPTCRARAKAAPPLAEVPPPPPVVQPAPVAQPTPVVQPTPAPRDEAPPARVAPVAAPTPAPEPVFSSAPRAATVPIQQRLSPTMVALCTAVVMVVLLAILYTFVLPRGSARSASSAINMEQPAAGAGTPAPAHAHPLAKHFEITGVRLMEGARGQVKIGYVIVNHSPANLPDVDARITLAAAGQNVFDFLVKIPSLGPYESRDMSSSIKTNLRPYEWPDWQAIRPSLRITSQP